MIGALAGMQTSVGRGRRAVHAAIAGLVAGTAALALAASAPAAQVTIERGQVRGEDRTARYWTPKRMARARPLPLLERGGQGAQRARAAARARRLDAPPFLSARVVDPLVPPYRTVGKLFGKVRGFGKFECSATVVEAPNRRVILTAGHCVKEPGFPFAKRLAFVPAYTDGDRPFGTFTWSQVRVPKQWLRANDSFDLATIRLRKRRRDGEKVADVTGASALGIAQPRDQVYGALGYPFRFDEGRFMWGCASEYAGDYPRRLPGGGPQPLGIGCDMRAGSSGGGWFTQSGLVAAVTSFTDRRDPDVLYGMHLGRKAAKLVRKSGRR